MEANPYMTVKEAAAQVGRSESTIKRWCEAETIVADQAAPGHEWMIDRRLFMRQFPRRDDIAHIAHSGQKTA